MAMLCQEHATVMGNIHSNAKRLNQLKATQKKLIERESEIKEKKAVVKAVQEMWRNRLEDANKEAEGALSPFAPGFSPPPSPTLNNNHQNTNKRKENPGPFNPYNTGNKSYHGASIMTTSTTTATTFQDSAPGGYSTSKVNVELNFDNVSNKWIEEAMALAHDAETTHAARMLSEFSQNAVTEAGPKTTGETAVDYDDDLLPSGGC